MKKNGFTLIELVVVIVILGILAVVAAPKFMNLQNDARNASLKGLEGALKSTFGVTYSKLAVAGLENESYVATRIKKVSDGSGTYGANLNIPGCSTKQDCVFAYGYPLNDSGTLKNLINNFNTDWRIANHTIENRITFKQFTVEAKDSAGKFDGYKMNRDNCYLTYIPASSTTSSYKLKFTPCK
ncbi:prepilin-type N-terminal cleavage/methylation domain-containing protein [Photobacterium carnosum]|uniref:type II secretion system protein n=1 Tax=Photobacterium carnosum TaxID=2023717 RepID=UPI001C8FBA34|nr:prepilin-type N-terminal cleavage/methylation domain-containing protein [Photobacterium carnosum]MBY3787669.1 prepilin-type N-terminal cleavage/methylation domain-containing protein [Photobacterium carnosum]MCD9497275.1 prepilin-type N-terminal cleavage/methylation domain-containing protein [Photobacterium carnosum]MCD9521711.1 prepilin-type N-terminal cleavage/methylation domain-containing protein [Photobacterium carnosum]MCD9532299.1 prepilin-type N-terminal cleavage/methylation domain-con